MRGSETIASLLLPPPPQRAEEGGWRGGREAPN
jgi:hypothetical protein